MMTREEKRNEVIKECMRLLRFATKRVDEEGKDIYDAYNWVYDKMSGMAYGYGTIREYELETIAEYYARVADNKVMKYLLNR